MIRYSLVCDKGHAFESWFRDAASYESQAAAGFLSCPECGSAKVGKAVMAPQVARKDRLPALVPAGAPAQPLALVSPEEAEFRAKVKELHEHLTRNSTDVGSQFAEQARKMHFGEAEHRTIHGQASPEDARSLLEDGVPFLPLPALPDDRN